VSSNAVVLTVNPCVPTGVDEQTIKNGNKYLTELYVSNQLLHIKNAQVGEQIRVTSTLGIVIYSGIITTDVLSVALPQHGVYVVTIGSKSQSVVY
jgi:CRISPR/Cas system-associated endonuclease Cas1